MKVSSKIESDSKKHLTFVSTNGENKEINIPLKANKGGSSINGGELLSLAFSTCFCNDIYREAEKRKILISKVEIETFIEFLKEGEGAHSIEYRVNIKGNATSEELKQLIKHTDTVAEVHNTIRKRTPISLII